MAALYGNAAMIDRLVKAGADAKQRGPNGETMIMLAARNGNPQALTALIEAGADVYVCESVRGATALMWRVERQLCVGVRVGLAAGVDRPVKSGGAGLP